MKQEGSEQGEEGAVACESTDLGDSTSVKRRKLNRRYRVRAKKEVMDCGAPENSEISNTGVARVLTDTRIPKHHGTLVEEPISFGMEVDRVLMDDHVLEQHTVVVESGGGS